MKIGIDAKWLFSQQISGRIFLQNILPFLISRHPEIEWHIFLDESNKSKEFPFISENVRVHYVWAGFNMLSNLFIIPKYARRLKLDAVLYQTFSPTGKSCKSIAFIHDVLHAPFPEYFTWKERLYFKILRWTAPHADRIITTTEYVRQELIRFNYSNDKQKIDIAPLGVTSIFKPAEVHSRDLLDRVKHKYGLPESYLLFVGRLNIRKNIENLVRAYRRIDNKNIALVIAGEKDWKAANTGDLITDNEIGSRIFFTGPPSDEELSAIYAMAKVFCFPSFAEGFGLPPLEAMASGVPVVVSNTTSLPGVCGPAALYADPNNPREIAEQINELLSNESLFAQKKQEGLEWVKNYSWTNTAERIVQSVLTTIKDS